MAKNSFVAEVNFNTIIFGECNQTCPKYPKQAYISLQYLHKSMGDQLIFCLQINIKVSYQMIVSLWVYIARHAQSTQNNRFTISLEYVKENVKNEVESDTIILDVCGQAYPYYPK